MLHSPEMVPLNFTEGGFTLVASNISVATGDLASEEIGVSNWHILFGCMPEELRVFITDLADCMANSSHPWAAYRVLMAYCLVALDRHLGVIPVGIM